MNAMLKTLFLDNPVLFREVQVFCQTRPGFRAAERAYEAQMRGLMDTLGYERFSEFEAALGRYTLQEVCAYYLFGLGLRQEILAALDGGR